MCHIPVFCWISATVLQNILEEKINNVVKNNQAGDASKTLQESNTEDTPKTLTQMYSHFLHFQIRQSRQKYDGEYRPDVSWDKDAILSLGKLVFQQLQRNNVISITQTWNTVVLMSIRHQCIQACVPRSLRRKQGSMLVPCTALFT